MVKQVGSRTPSTGVQLNYQLLRNTTSPDEQASGVKSYVANLAADQILKLDTQDNLRGYIAEYNARKRNGVHVAIRRTIDTEPQRFITRNSGFVVSATDIEVNDSAKTVSLVDPSILNGAQSQGEIRGWLQEVYGDEASTDGAQPPFYVRVEIIVDPDPREIVETAIARNTATPVKSISQAGARGHLDELELEIQKRHPNLKIRRSETDLDEEVYDTRKILQYARLLMPASVSRNETASEKLRPYKNPEQCLKEFSQWWMDRKTDLVAAEKYRFMIEIASQAIDEYAYWERNEAWNGAGLFEETKKGGRACRRDKKTGKVVWVSPGIIFPIVGAMGEFVTQDESGRWILRKPSLFKPREMVARAIAQFRSVDSDPMQMGRSAGVYDALRIYPSTIVEVMHDMEESQATAPR